MASSGTGPGTATAGDAADCGASGLEKFRVEKSRVAGLAENRLLDKVALVMAPPPAPVQKKRRMGCCGCGCLVLVILALLFGALVGGTSYLVYTKLTALTSVVADDVPNFDGGDEMYKAAKQKLDDLTHNVDAHQATLVRFSADEINTLIARNNLFSDHQVHLFVSMTDDQGRLQATVPTDIIPGGFFKNRHLNLDTSFGVSLDTSNHSLAIVLQSFRVGKDESPKTILPTAQTELSLFLNLELQKDPTWSHVLQQAKSIEIKGGQLEVDTQ